jgi:hypothetical protein
LSSRLFPFRKPFVTDRAHSQGSARRHAPVFPRKQRPGSISTKHGERSLRPRREFFGDKVENGTFLESGRYLAEGITVMAIILLSMTMFFAMLFATANALRNESRGDRNGLTRDHLLK